MCSAILLFLFTDDDRAQSVKQRICDSRVVDKRLLYREKYLKKKEKDLIYHLSDSVLSHSLSVQTHTTQNPFAQLFPRVIQPQWFGAKI